MKKLAALLCTGCLLASATPNSAHAFCGFYVTGADASLYANATMVVLMRDGTRTVVSMQNNYQGPPEDFALVVPVPTVLTKDMVKTLPRDVFTRVDTLAAPRLVEYWEGDPCAPVPELAFAGAAPTSARALSDSATVKVEAQFAVGEYDVVILSASDSSGLETWLHDNQYNIPSGASSVLAPYVASGTKFFVAKVDTSRVKFKDGQAVLSPLRFYYDTQDFSLPVRLGLLNSQGTQDLIVSILAPSRYQVANHPNTTIPTNIRVQDDVRNDFPGFYEALFSKVVEKNPGAVVTEYAWSASSCDPCPTPPLSQQDLATLGSDVTAPSTQDTPAPFVNYTLTRLHYRYTKDTLGEDLMFEQADPLVGGRGIPDADGKLPNTESSQAFGGGNAFQGRYVILHPWDKEVRCQSPVRGRWGGPNNPGSSPQAMAASNTALSGTPPRASAALSTLVAQPIAALDVMPAPPSKAKASGADAKSDPTDDAGTAQDSGTRSADAGLPTRHQTGAAAGAHADQASTASASSGTASNSPASPERTSNCSCQLTKAQGAPGSLVVFALGPMLWFVRRRRRRTS